MYEATAFRNFVSASAPGEDPIICGINGYSCEVFFLDDETVFVDIPRVDIGTGEIHNDETHESPPLGQHALVANEPPVLESRRRRIRFAFRMRHINRNTSMPDEARIPDPPMFRIGHATMFMA